MIISLSFKAHWNFDLIRITLCSCFVFYAFACWLKVSGVINLNVKICKRKHTRMHTHAHPHTDTHMHTTHTFAERGVKRVKINAPLPIKALRHAHSPPSTASWGNPECCQPELPPNTPSTFVFHVEAFLIKIPNRLKQSARSKTLAASSPAGVAGVCACACVCVCVLFLLLLQLAAKPPTESQSEFARIDCSTCK